MGAGDEGTTAADHPFKGLILCCTSVSADIRNDITAKATDLGAVWKQDLTSDATHLIVGDLATQKYRYVAKQRPDVKPMRISFIEKAHEAWVATKSIPIHELEVEHAFPPFLGLRICSTNINDEKERQKIQKITEENGGTYSGDLTKQVTHLVASNPEGKKYQFAKQWGIKIVSLEWFHHSVERGMALDEAYFSFDLPASERGQGAWVRSATGKRKLSEREGSGSSDGRVKSDPAKRKIKRAASDRLSSGSQTLWGDIMGTKAVKVDKPNEWGTDAPQRTSSKAESSTTGPVDVPYVNVRTSMSMSDLQPEIPKKMFHDKGFHVYGFDADKESRIRGIIRGFDGNTYPALQDLFETPASRYVIVVPDSYIQADCPKISDASKAVQIVTAWWLERCLHEDKFIEPDEYLLGRPMKRHNISGFEKMTVSVTKFDGVDYLHYTKAIGKLGAEFCEKVYKARSLLIVNSADKSKHKDKERAAEAWGIPIVSQEWLLECISEGELIPFKKYLLNTKPIAEEKDGEVEVKKEGSTALENVTVKFDSAVKEDRDKLEQAVFYLGGYVTSSFDSEIPITHFVTTTETASQAAASGPKHLSSEIRRAWRTDGVMVVTDTWLKMSMKRRERWPEGKYIVKKPEMKDLAETIPKKPRVPLFEESRAVKPAQKSHTLLQEDSNNPFIIEDIDIPPDVEETTTRLRPLSISPVAEKRRPSASKSQPASLTTTPSKSKFMTLKSPAKKSPSQLPLAVPPLLFDKDGSHSGSLLRNNLTEILRSVKQQENKPPSRRPPRKLQGRANSTSEEGSLIPAGNSLSRHNSLQSNPTEGQDSVDTTTTTNSRYQYHLTTLSRDNSLASNTLDFGESMIYDSNPESGPRNLQQDPDSEQQPLSQVVHYVDAEAEADRKKLFEKLKMVDDGGVLKGRLVVKSTVAAQELGGPVTRVGRARKV
ncbi:hypothetical protein TWF102_008487 [Orbilia oligospora]|uniref:BRCT domain-containing protein n=1 Tax=Orbilia oligospora TaxID=2813651 RepID=A0A7C8N5A1_ORBOL|nr:hypothetical protein TWF103_000926 [Orbilia oligospora]KAF3092412.1 hypothetical protein TWF102_008487 [Orbilia oligospora]KAF3109503.1 hypothetical protein TWF706_001375 [Orbilia oligospora]KAF3145862.1 hypothetical protein TWF594_003848 [Orbilia oligospora]